MVYVVKWTENGKSREIVVQLHRTAVAILNALILNCSNYSARIVGRRG